MALPKKVTLVEVGPREGFQFEGIGQPDKISTADKIRLVDALSIALLYRKRWRIELLFKWMKQHLHIKAFFGTTPNAVKTQLWIAVLVYVLVHLLKHRYGLRQTPNEIVQILGVMVFEKTPISQVFSEIQQKDAEDENRNQLILFDF